jgi:hypothetical protein
LSMTQSFPVLAGPERTMGKEILAICKRFLP